MRRKNLVLGDAVYFNLLTQAMIQTGSYHSTHLAAISHLVP